MSVVSFEGSASPRSIRVPPVAIPIESKIPVPPVSQVSAEQLKSSPSKWATRFMLFRSSELPVLKAVGWNPSTSHAGAPQPYLAT